MSDNDIDYSAAMFNGIPLVTGRYDTAPVRFVFEVNREISISGPGRETSYHDAKELFEQVSMACEMADPDGFREVLDTLPRYCDGRKDHQ